MRIVLSFLLDKWPHERPGDGVADAKVPFLRPVEIGMGDAAAEDAQRMERIVGGPFPRK